MLPKYKSFAVLSACLTLEAVVLSVVLAMLAGLFHPQVDNTEIFKLISPAFNTIIGCLVGLLAGHALGRAPSSDKEGPSHE